MGPLGSFFGPVGLWYVGRGRRIMRVAMKMQRVLIMACGLLFGLTIRVCADNDAASYSPDYYSPMVDPKKMQKELTRLENGKLTPQDLNSLAAEIHNVSVLSATDSQPDILPASARPQGDLKLNVVYPSN